MFDRATIRLGIGPHSSFSLNYSVKRKLRHFRDAKIVKWFKSEDEIAIDTWTTQSKQVSSVQSSSCDMNEPFRPLKAAEYKICLCKVLHNVAHKEVEDNTKHELSSCSDGRPCKSKVGRKVWGLLCSFPWWELVPM